MGAFLALLAGGATYVGVSAFLEVTAGALQTLSSDVEVVIGRAALGLGAAVWALTTAIVLAANRD